MTDQNNATEKESIFRWETLQVIGDHELDLPDPVTGKLMEVELTSGRIIEVFRANDSVFYFCHGLSFGGKMAPGGSISPFSGNPVTTILEDFFIEREPRDAAIAGDLAIWYNSNGVPIHSAVILGCSPHTEPLVLDYSTLLRTKNGSHPESVVSLESLIDIYGKRCVIFTRNQ